MFGELIGRWISFAKFSDNAHIRSGRHTRHLDWPNELLLAENQRLLFDVDLARSVVSQRSHAVDIALAFAMGTHHRIGAVSEVRHLIPDLVRHIVLHGSMQTMEETHRRALVEKLFSQQTLLYSPRDYVCRFNVKRLLLSGELHGVPAFQWPPRPPYFFCKRGWFAGVNPQFAPPEAITGGSVAGIFESIPHIFCRTRFPVFRTLLRCRHLLHVSRIGPLQTQPH